MDDSDSGPDKGTHLDTVTVERPGSPRYSTSVLRTASGELAYPGFVPPSVQSLEPEDGPSHNVNRATPRQQGNHALGAQHESTEDESTASEDAPESRAAPPRKARTFPAAMGRVKSASAPRRAPAVPTLERLKTAGNPIRPAVTKDWYSEANRRGNAASTSQKPPGMNRAGTSFLNTAIWQRCDDEYESSEDSDEDHEYVPPADSAARAQADQAREDREEKLRADESHGGRKHTSLGGTDTDDRYRRFLVGNENYQSKGKIKKDGRLRITVNETSGTGYIAKALGAAMQKIKPKEGDEASPTSKVRTKDIPKLSPASSFTTEDVLPLPKLNIVIMVIGSRGDVQPFLKIGKILKEQYGHRVRIATHPTFRSYIERDSGLEFFSAGGDPSELMAFMVKNPGMIPTLETVRAGDIGKRRAAMRTMFDGFWRACVNATDDETDSQNLKMMGSKPPFVADAIIANPPSFAHVHCAEALGIPLHLCFTFPYTPTTAFPHPLASIKTSNVDPGYTNFISYPMVEMMIWQGLGDLVNDFRVKTLSLDPVSTLWAPGATYRMHVPFTYLWSPGLVPKPRDWGDYIDLAGFVYLDLAATYTPPTDLKEFLAKGEAPIYIGFGSIVVDDADRFTEMIFEAVKMAGVRALVSKGWGGLGSENVPENVFMLENVPHDWLFPKVKACVIHGGAGTTAIALKVGLPTMVVPFFGDQHFWGQMISRAGVGPDAVPYKHLDAEKLAEGIRYCLTDAAREAAQKIAASIDSEGDGAHNAVRSFHRHLNLRGPTTMRCSVFKDQIASWQPKNTHVKLSPLAADMLVDAGLVKWSRLRLLRHQEWNDFEGPGEPVTGIAGSLTHTVGNTFKGVGGLPVKLAKTSHKYRKRFMRKREERKAKDARQAPNGHANVQIEHNNQGITVTDDDQTLNPEQTVTHDIHEEIVGDVATGVGLTASAIAMAPVDLSLALAQGFHNAPRLYGDDTVRKPVRITGIRSGLRASRKEFVYGVYDGFTGVVLLPVRGAKQDGVAGLVKGTGMGLTGLVLKNISAVVGPVGYTMKGLVKQVERNKSPQKFVRRARIVQGQREAQALNEQERKKLEKQVVEAYHLYRDLCDAINNEERRRGLAGQWDRYFVDTGMLFEDMDIAKKSLRALRKGNSLESVILPFDDSSKGRRSRESKEKERKKKSFSTRRSFGRKRENMDDGNETHTSTSTAA